MLEGFEQISKYINNKGSSFYQRKKLTNMKRQKGRINHVYWAGIKNNWYVFFIYIDK